MPVNKVCTDSAIFCPQLFTCCGWYQLAPKVWFNALCNLLTEVLKR